MADSRLITGALPVETLHEIHDCLILALDASAAPRGYYTQAERETRSYVRAALRQITKMIGGAA